VIQNQRSTGVIIGVGVVVCVVLGLLAAMGYGVLLLVAIVGGAGLLLVQKQGPNLSLLDTTIVIIVAGYIVLNRGWSYVGIPLGPVPLYLGEITIVLGGISLLTKLSERPKPVRRTAAVWLIPMVIVGGVHMAWDVSQSGLEAIRNFSLVYTIALIPCGYYMVLNRSRARRVLQLVGAALLVQVVYTSLYPWRLSSMAWSFKISEGVSLFGNHATGYLFVITGVFFAFLVAPRLFRWDPIWTRLLVLWGIVVLFMVQSRGGFLAGFLCMIVLIAVGRRYFARRALGTFAALAVVFVTLSSVGLQLKGDRSMVSVDTFTTIVRSIVDGTLEDEVSHHADLAPMSRAKVRGMTGSRNLRLKWWKRLIDENLETVPTAIFGRGFAHVLITDDLGTGFMVRHPHNVYVTVFARLGMVGSVSFIAYLLVLFVQFVRAAKLTSSADSAHRDLLLFFGMFLVASLATGMFSPLYESPHFAVPLYFLFGVGSGLLDLHRRGEWGAGLFEDDAVPVETPAE